MKVLSDMESENRQPLIGPHGGIIPHAGLKPWLPGQSGNPGGRPKKPLTERLIAQLVKDGESETAAVIQSLLASAKNPESSQSVRAITEIFDRVEGKVADRLSGEDGGELVVKIIAVGR